VENHNTKILVADDEAAVRRILKTRLSMAGYDVVTAADGEETLDVFYKESPDLVVLDVMMPKRDGYYVCQEIRKESDVPVILLTALGDVADRITGLQLGADDYIVKPFSPKELEARMSSILRRVTANNPSKITGSGVIQLGRLRLDTNKRRLYLGQELVRLTGIEFDLLQLLVSNSGAAVTREDILKTIWGYAPRGSDDLRLVDVHVSRLRAKIEENPKQPELVMTARGTGYFFQRVVEVPHVVGA
jgi:OmpR family response regulator RpaB